MDPTIEIEPLEIPSPIGAEPPESLAGKMKAILLHPKSFFEALPSDEKPSLSLSVAIVAGTIGMAGLIFWDGLFDWLFSNGSLAEALGLWVVIGLLLIGGLLFPLFVILYQILLSLFYHLSLRIFGAAGGSFRRTFTVLAYSQAPFILGTIPIIGGNIGMIWSLVILVKGLKVVHHLSTGRTVLAVILPVLLFLLPLVFFGVGLLPEAVEEP